MERENAVIVGEDAFDAADDVRDGEGLAADLGEELDVEEETWHGG